MKQSISVCRILCATKPLISKASTAKCKRTRSFFTQPANSKKAVPYEPSHSIEQTASHTVIKLPPSMQSTSVHNRSAADHQVGGCFHLFDKLEFGGESPLTMRAWYSAFRYCPDPLGIVTAKQLDKLEFIKCFLLDAVQYILLFR